MDTKTHINPLDDFKLKSVFSTSSQENSSSSQWPPAPQSLVPSRSSGIFAMICDLFLPAAPPFLIAKTVLVIHASDVDAGKSGQPGDKVSSLTTYLVAFNGQVSVPKVIYGNFALAYDYSSSSLFSRSCSSQPSPRLSNALLSIKPRRAHQSPHWSNTKAVPHSPVRSR